MALYDSIYEGLSLFKNAIHMKVYLSSKWVVEFKNVFSEISIFNPDDMNSRGEILEKILSTEPIPYSCQEATSMKEDNDAVDQSLEDKWSTIVDYTKKKCEEYIEKSNKKLVDSVSQSQNDPERKKVCKLISNISVMRDAFSSKKLDTLYALNLKNPLDILVGARGYSYLDIDKDL